jgi:uncharacterized membrane protein YhaH (DUF805 family)
MDYAWFLFSFAGRINRARYWLAALVIVCWMIFLAMLVLAVAKIFGNARPASFGYDVGDIFRIVDPAALRSAIGSLHRFDLAWANLVPLFFYAIGTPLFLWCYVATSIKRLHDRDKGAWWMVPFFVAPGLYDQFGDRLGDSYPAALLGLIASVLVLWGFVEMACLKGSGGANRFGADPLAPLSPGADAASRWDQHGELEFPVRGAGPWPGSHVKRGHE